MCRAPRSSAAPTPSPAKRQDRSFAYTIMLWRYHGHGERGTTTIGPDCGSTTPGALKCVVLFFFLFLPTGLRTSEALSGSRPAELTMQQPGKIKATTNIQLVSITSIFIHQSTAYPWRGTCLTVPSLAYRTICIVLHLQQFFLE